MIQVRASQEAKVSIAQLVLRSGQAHNLELTNVHEHEIVRQILLVAGMGEEAAERAFLAAHQQAAERLPQPGEQDSTSEDGALDGDSESGKVYEERQ